MPWNNAVKSEKISFDIKHLLESVSGCKGLDFPITLTREAKHNGTELADNGTVLRKKDLTGCYYFMPVTFSYNSKSYEIDCAMVRLRLKKNIVQTPLLGQGGMVKEMVGVQDLAISITGCLMGERGQWPEDRINGLRQLFETNDSVALKCALTDCFFDADDKVVITDMCFPQGGQVEDIVPVNIECVQDNIFELTLN
ncbi:MAG: hypothetical protein J1F29_00735 [Lentimicrobiaceae bacterium]|nr:hypothetical protein [Lentimicrobiaceae bacterium]